MRAELPVGTDRSYCTSCDQTFGSSTQFDEHRNHKGRSATCKKPAALGLVERNGFWDTPDGHTKRQTAGERLRGVRRGDATEQAES